MRIDEFTVSEKSNSTFCFLAFQLEELRILTLRIENLRFREVKLKRDSSSPSNSKKNELYLPLVCLTSSKVTVIAVLVSKSTAK